MSVDGKLAFKDDPAGPVVARANRLDQDGALADFWVMNLNRANADICFCGAGTMQKEPNGVVCIFDQELEDARVTAGKLPAPWVVICSLDGSDIPFEDTLFRTQPAMFNTSRAGLERVKKGLTEDHFVVGPFASGEDIDTRQIRKEFEARSPREIPVIITGDDTPDNLMVLRILKAMGMSTAAVESPSLCHSLMGDGLLDEIFLNYSCLYIGGDATGFGMGMTPFSSVDHPHTEMLTLHTHGPHFFHFRQRLIYGA